MGGAIHGRRGYRKSAFGPIRLTGGCVGEPNPTLETRPYNAPPEGQCGILHIAGGPKFAPVYPDGAIAGAAEGCGNNCLIQSLLQIATGRGRSL